LTGLAGFLPTVVAQQQDICEDYVEMEIHCNQVDAAVLLFTSRTEKFEDIIADLEAQLSQGTVESGYNDTVCAAGLAESDDVLPTAF
jgi:predicted  nucleic acid-binding Zn-ribbon protein